MLMPMQCLAETFGVILHDLDKKVTQTAYYIAKAKVAKAKDKKGSTEVNLPAKLTPSANVHNNCSCLDLLLKHLTCWGLYCALHMGGQATSGLPLHSSSLGSCATAPS